MKCMKILETLLRNKTTMEKIKQLRQRKPLRVFIWQIVSVWLTSLLALAVDSNFAFALVPLMNAIIKEFNVITLWDFWVTKVQE
jgi:hypothetical protein